MSSSFIIIIKRIIKRISSNSNFQQSKINNKLELREE